MGWAVQDYGDTTVFALFHGHDGSAWYYGDTYFV